MKTHFLTGNFLLAYAGAYRYRAGYGEPAEKADTAWLQDRFGYRAQRQRQRRQSYLLGIQVATVLALLVAIGVTMIEIQSSDSHDLAAAEQERIDLQEIVQTVQKALPPPPPRPAIQTVVPDDELLEDAYLDLDAALDVTATAAALPPPPEPEKEDAENEREVFVVVEESPKIIGGVAELARALTYPSIARNAGIEGMVVVKVIVTAEGLPIQPTVLSSPSEVLNEAAVDAVMKQRFTPGRQRGRAVAVEMAIPVRFRLTDDT